MCLHECCSEPPSKWAKITINEIPILIALCWEHAKEMEENE